MLETNVQIWNKNGIMSKQKDERKWANQAQSTSRSVVFLLYWRMLCERRRCSNDKWFESAARKQICWRNLSSLNRRWSIDEEQKRRRWRVKAIQMLWGWDLKERTTVAWCVSTNQKRTTWQRKHLSQSEESLKLEVINRPSISTLSAMLQNK